MPATKKRGRSTLGDVCRGSALGDALVAAALEGFRKKRRLKEYERLELPHRIEREWKESRIRMMRTGEACAISYHVFEFNAADKCREFEPTVEDVTNALPEELKEMMADPRFEVMVSEGTDPASTGVFRISIDAQEETLKARKEEEEAADEDTW